MTNDQPNDGQALRAIRLGAKMSIAALAGLTGYSQAHIRNVEAGRKTGSSSLYYLCNLALTNPERLAHVQGKTTCRH